MSGQFKDSIDIVASGKSRRYSEGLDLRRNEDSPMHCDSCHRYFGFWRMLRYSLFVTIGKSYIIRCRCGHGNVRTKGMLRDKK